MPKEDFNFEAAFAKFNKDNLVKVGNRLCCMTLQHLGS